MIEQLMRGNIHKTEINQIRSDRIEENDLRISREWKEKRDEKAEILLMQSHLNCIENVSRSSSSSCDDHT